MFQNLRHSGCTNSFEVVVEVRHVSWIMSDRFLSQHRTVTLFNTAGKGAQPVNMDCRCSAPDTNCVLTLSTALISIPICRVRALLTPNSWLTGLTGNSTIMLKSHERKIEGCIKINFKMNKLNKISDSSQSVLYLY